MTPVSPGHGMPNAQSQKADPYPWSSAKPIEIKIKSLTIRLIRKERIYFNAECEIFSLRSTVFNLYFSCFLHRKQLVGYLYEKGPSFLPLDRPCSSSCVPPPTTMSTAARNSTQSCPKGEEWAHVGKRVATSSIQVVLLPTPSLALLRDPQFFPGQEPQGPAGICCLGGDVGKSCYLDFPQRVVVACLK